MLFFLNMKDIKDSITKNAKDLENSKPYCPKPVDLTSFEIDKGTRIIITQFDKNVNRTEHYLRRRLARRFSIIDFGTKDKGDEFQVKLNSKPITLEDRDYFSKVQFLWLIGSENDIYSSKFPNIGWWVHL